MARFFGAPIGVPLHRFVRLGRMVSRKTTAVCVVAVILVVIFWVFAILTFSYYTSGDYLWLYWQRKCGVE